MNHESWQKALSKVIMREPSLLQILSKPLCQTHFWEITHPKMHHNRHHRRHYHHHHHHCHCHIHILTPRICDPCYCCCCCYSVTKKRLTHYPTAITHYPMAIHSIQSTTRESHSLSARRTRRTISRGPKGLQLEVGARRAPRLLVHHNLQCLCARHSSEKSFLHPSFPSFVTEYIQSSIMFCSDIWNQYFAPIFFWTISKSFFW